MVLEIFFFIIACCLLTWLNSHLVKSLVKIARFFGIREFIIAFFVLGISVNLPNLFVDLGSALRGFPQIALGDMIGGNLVDLTLVIALAIFFSKRYISADSRIVQTSSIFTFVIALLPLLLLAKGDVTRVDGLILISIYFIYSLWMFGRDERFKKEFSKKVTISKVQVVVMLVEVVAILALLLFVSQEIINAATAFAGTLGTSLSLVAILVIGLANCFPEMYLSIISIRRGQNWMVLGDLMSSVIGAATLVFGLVALVHPFVISDVAHIFVARIFLVAAAFLFLIVIHTGRKLTKREGMVLLFMYIAFLITEIFIKL